MNPGKIPLKVIADLNIKLAEGMTWLFESVEGKNQDRYGIKRSGFHALILIGTPYLFTIGYGIHGLDIPIWLGGLGLTAHAWRSVYRKEKEPDTYGNARFGELSELKKAKLVGKTGLFFGKMKGEFVVKSEIEEGHVIVLGGPGLGKTSGFVIPSLWRWKDSVLAFDPKGGELASKTAKFRSRFQKVYVFNPFDEGCHRYNPIEHCGTTDEALSMAQILIPSESKENAFWTESARAIVAAAIWEGKTKRRTLTEICKFICLHDVEQLKEYYLNHPNEKVRLLAAPLRHLEDKVMAGVMADLMRNLNVIAQDDHIKFATSRSDWDLNELENRSTIYLSVPEEKLKLPQFRKILNIIINQAVDHLSKRKEPTDETPRILMMIDELPTLGHVPSLLTALATLRSRGVTIAMAFQSLSQLDEVYGRNGRKTIMDVSRFKLVFGVEDPETQKYFTDRAGQRTVKTESKNRSEDHDGNERISYSESETGVPLIRPNEWANLKQPVLFSTIEHPVMVEKIKYWEDFQLHRLMRHDLKQVERLQEKRDEFINIMKDVAGFEEVAASAEVEERREVQ
jgi:type IV secretion system protein VirD4